MGPTNQRSRWILLQKNAGCEKKDVYTDIEDKTSIQTLGLESCNGN